MNNVDIQNRGMSQTISSINGKQHVDQIKWDAGFDGKNADVSFDLMKDGKTGHFDVQLDKDALAKMLNMKTVNKPIEKRLLSTFSSTFGKSGAKTTFGKTKSKSTFGKSGAKSRAKRIPLEQMIIEFDDPPYPLLKKVEQNPSYPLLKKVKQNPSYPLLKKVKQNQMLLGPSFENPLFQKAEPNPREIEVPNQLSRLLEQLTHISSPFANEKIVVPVQKSSIRKSTFKNNGAKSKKMR